MIFCLFPLQFIQPQGQAPATTIHIAIPEIALPYTHSTIYFLRQYLLQRFHTPRFTENNPEFHFKNYSGTTSNFASEEPLPLNDVYLYNRREKKGFGKCIEYRGARFVANNLLNFLHRRVILGRLMLYCLCNT